VSQILTFARPSSAWLRSLSQAALVLCALLFALPSWALTPPKLDGRINDQAALLSASEAQSLEKKLEARSRRGSAPAPVIRACSRRSPVSSSEPFAGGTTSPPTMGQSAQRKPTSVWGLSGSAWRRAQAEASAAASR
jgi:hypothetical protein